MEFFHVVPSIIEKIVTNVLIPHREGQTAGAALVCAVKTTIIISDRLAIEEVDAVIVPFEAAAMAVDDIECDGDAVDMAQIDENLELGGGGGDVLDGEERRFLFSGQKLV
jgi:hypothetical protein